jgi:hypothetical protein
MNFPFQVICKKLPDPSIYTLIDQMLKFKFQTILEKEKLMKENEKISFLSELSIYLEVNLRKKISENINVIISKKPLYAMKIDNHFYIGIKYDQFEIFIYKSPMICIPSKFIKKIKDESFKIAVETHKNQ